MNIKFCGAAGTVTGSCHLVELDSGYKILLDCGLYQGREEDFETFNSEWHFNPASIDLLLLSHAHIDHCGRVPKLVKDGFRGDILCTSATRDLAAVLMMDSAYIQEQDARYMNKRRKGNSTSVEALYTSGDVKTTLQQFVGIAYNRWFKINDQLTVFFSDAGHIFGSASVSMRINQVGRKEVMLGFSGDIGRPDRPILRDPQPMVDMDYFIIESTYGGKEHQNAPSDKNFLLQIIDETCLKKGGKLIIPAFSVGRTQEIVFMLDQLNTEGLLPPIDVYVDSPLAINATDIFIMHPECYDQDLQTYLEKDPYPFSFKGLKFTRSAEESKAINHSDDPCIIISSSGMMQAGRIRHHLKNNIENPKNTLLVVGYCASGTLGAQIRNGAKEIWLFRKQYKVKARVEIMDGFSAHADHSELMDFIDPMDRKKLKKIFLVHGDDKQRYALQTALKQKGFRDVISPDFLETFALN